MQKFQKTKIDYSSSTRPLFSSTVNNYPWKNILIASITSFAVVFIFLTANHYVKKVTIEPKTITQETPIPKIKTQTETQANNNFVSQQKNIWTKITIKPGDNLAKIFSKLKLGPQQLQEVLEIKHNQKYFKQLFPEQELYFLITPEKKLQSLKYTFDDLHTLVINRNQDGQLSFHIDQLNIEKRIAFGHATIKDSLFLAAKRANLPDKLIMELAEIFAYDIDFALDIRPNDTFKVLYEERFINGKKIGSGPILAAEFINRGKNYQAIRFTNKDGKSEYFGPQGNSLKKAFIRTPVKYTRISSHFNLHRKHPSLHKIRAHKGVDYAAPRGTPVKASGYGKVEFKGKQGGYGNVVILKHGNKYSTLYAHLSKFAKSLKKGQSVEQGQIIGYVGSTGLATGPHLHYEFRVNGVHRNPLTVALPKARSIAKAEKQTFMKHAHNMVNLMNYHDKVMLASND